MYWCSVIGLFIISAYSVSGESGILLSSSKGIKLYTEDSHEPRDITTVKARAIDYHYARKEVYFYYNKTILRASLEGSSDQEPTVVLTLSSGPIDLAVDWVHDRLYWVCHGVNQSVVESATLDGADHKVVVDLTSNSPNLDNIVIDPFEGKLFLLHDEKAYSANLDGTNLQELPTGYVKPQVIAVDNAKKLVYVAGDYHDFQRHLGKRHYNGSSAGEDVVIPTNGGHVLSLAVLGQDVYWESAYEGARFQKGRLDENGEIKDIRVVVQAQYLVFDMKLYHPDVQPSKQ